MRVLVTGGLGYIGSHTSIELIEHGHDILIIDNLSNSSEEILGKIEFITKKKINFIKDNIYNINNHLRLIKKFKPEAIIHFAGLKSVEESERNPLIYYQENVSNAIKLINFIEQIKCKKFIFSSSATVYGKPIYLPYDEKHPLKPTNTYGKTKLIIENILNDWCKSNGTNSAVLLRYFNPIGAHESGLIGESPIGIPNNLMPYILNVATGKAEKLFVFGDDYKTKDGSGVRDYIHVSDLAKGHLAALEYSSNSSGCNSFNLGTGRGLSVFEMIRVFEKVSGIKIKYKVVNRRDGDVAEFWANASKAKKELKWEALSDINKMCKDLWFWQSRNKTE